MNHVLKLIFLTIEKFAFCSILQFTVVTTFYLLILGRISACSDVTLLDKDLNISTVDFLIFCKPMINQ